MTDQDFDETDMAITSLGVRMDSYEDACNLRRAANAAVGEGSCATFIWNGQRLFAERMDDGDGVEYLAVSRA